MRRTTLKAAALAALAAAAACGGGRDRSEVEARYMTDADRFVDVAGARVRVREQGPADGPPLVLVHGFTVSLESFDGWAEALSDTFRIIRFDLPAHGLTGPDPQERYSNEQTGAFIGDLMDALGVDSAALAGNSLGGLAAWRFAAAEPGRVDKLILIAPGGYPLPDAPPEGVVPRGMQFFLCSAPKAGVRAAMEAYRGDGDTVTDAEVDRTFDLMRAEGNCEAMIRRLEVWTLPDPAPALSTIDAPTLLMWGEADSLLPFEQAARFTDALPNERLIAYETLGHVPHEENPARTAADARAFLLE